MFIYGTLIPNTLKLSLLLDVPTDLFTNVTIARSSVGRNDILLAIEMIYSHLLVHNVFTDFDVNALTLPRLLARRMPVSFF